jgi:3-oxoacyl-(acyl-carrier-protein) synthase
VGQVREVEQPQEGLPRTHCLAYAAAVQAMVGESLPPDAIVLGTTTGGILTTEQQLREENRDKAAYRLHGLGTVADYLAGKLGCSGPVLTVSTACSSGAVAMAVALKMLRSGRTDRVLVGGVDSLCRLTYFGFNSLQLVDRNGCRPLDARRRGMAVAEGAGMLLLSTARPGQPSAEVLGAGLSCDAYHPAAPHPEGQGALAAMQAALDDAGMRAEDIDYINLHGTGTPDNDLAEAKAVHRLFADPPSLSSIKGASGHSLAAAGALEAVVAAIAVTKDFRPANTGFEQADPALDLQPLTEPVNTATKAVLSNSFGFGGNNGSLLIGKADHFSLRPQQPAGGRLAILGYSCLTGAGDLQTTLAALESGTSAAGMASLAAISENLPPRLIRRLKRLPRMTLSLAIAAHACSGQETTPASIFMGTGWGALSETHDFLSRLTESEEKFPSPTDFVGSVHNAPASQAAMLFGATGPNITTSNGDYSFEQALYCADLFTDSAEDTALVLGADEGHEVFSPLFDASISGQTTLADGGGALCLSRTTEGDWPCVRIPFYAHSRMDDVITALVKSLGGRQALADSCALVLAGIPAAMRDTAEQQLAAFLARANLSTPVVRYREIVGEFASASAAAAGLAASCVTAGRIPQSMSRGHEIRLKDGATVLVLGLGEYLTAMEFSRT